MRPEDFVRSAAPKRGSHNPTPTRNAAWEWMIRRGGNAWIAREDLGVQAEIEPPTWCFERFGMSCTALEDGRLVCIGGEHEDGYDPDFYIYNDVIVFARDGDADGVDLKTAAIEIFGYPETAFPATDFHTATRVGELIYIIGSLGYGEHDDDDETPVFVLDTKSWRIEPIATHGTGPGRIHSHAATFDTATRSILVGSGDVLRKGKIRRNEGTFRLHLDHGRWERIQRTTMRRRFELEARDPRGGRPVTDCLRFSDPSWRRLVSIETNVVDYHWAEAHGALIECRDWGGSFDLRVDGMVDDVAVAALLEDLEVNLRQQSGCEWSIAQRPEYG